MTAVITRPTAEPAAPDAGRPAPPAQPVRKQRSPALGDRQLTLAVVLLVMAGCLSLMRVYVGLGFLAPVLGGALLALALSWGCRRAALGSAFGLAATVAGWAAFTSAAYLRDTLWAGALPTLATAGAGWDLWVYGLELIRVRTSPAFAEPALLFVTVTGVWTVAYAIDGLVFRARAPLRAITLAVVLWTVPLAIEGSIRRSWLIAVPLLAASAALLRAHANTDVAAWGKQVIAPGSQLRRVRGRGQMGGWGMVAAALVSGALVATVLPGYGHPPWYDLSGISRSTLTANPIVNIRSSLVATDERPLLQVSSPRPVYLRITALDVYSEREEWTNDGIKAARIDGAIDSQVSDRASERVPVEVTVLENAGRPIFAPAPYQPVAVTPPAGSQLQYDARLATLVADTRDPMGPGDRYQIVSRIPDPTAEVLDEVRLLDPEGPLTELPENVPPQVADFAREIVDAAGADTPFQQALAIQQELRSWSYSLSPPAGHSAHAMVSFLEQRIGYCEQFAGTMAVMLRTLDIPSRVAVGYTPGLLVEGQQDTYEVSASNLHAWVEVLFPGLGWIAFEPTPRGDGNVLVPSREDLAPQTTLGPLGAAAAAGLLPGNIPFDQQFLPQSGDIPVRSAVDVTGLGGAARGAAARGLPIAAGAGLIAALVAAVAGKRRRIALAAMGPADRVLHLRDRMQAIGVGLGIRAQPSETDGEYLRRLTGDHPEATRLAAHTARARYATWLPEEAAREAEASSDVLTRDLLGTLNRRQRLAAHARSRLSSLADNARRTAQGMSSLLRRKA